MTLSVMEGLDRWSPSASGGYRTRLIGLLGRDLTKDEVLEALIFSRFMNQSPSQLLHTDVEKGLLASYEHELSLSDRDAKP